MIENDEATAAPMQVIQNRWYVVLSSSELSSERPVGRRRFGLELVFWRDAEGRVAVATDRCPHRRAKLSLGRVKGGCVECPFHGFTFDRDGACRSIPAHPERSIPRAMHLTTATVREEHGFVWLWTGPAEAPEGPIPFFDFEGFSHAGSEHTEPVHVHYTLAIENQLDFAHLPFVHRTTIGRSMAPGPMVVRTEIEGDRIRAWLDGQDGFLELLGPNVWRLRLSSDLHQQIAFVPVDEQRMLYYVRTYQRVVTLPGLDRLFGTFQRAFNPLILRQDSRVVESIANGETRLRGMGEVLVPSDVAIIAYRRWREANRGPLAAFGPPDTSEEEGELVHPSTLVRHLDPARRAELELDRIA
ncbi:MAG: aromatic ring-hydroxylating dioxygenase subunit alpha [Deltaproteobacteria bacterium]|nr:aromatic ring-hydroxylating dioxygenase subunit alpha [Deltaproteobacteria bacterium]